MRYPVLFLMTSALCACKTAPATQPPTSTDLTEKPSDEAEVKAVEALTPEMRRAIFAGLGCPEEAITSDGCKVCPTAVSLWSTAPRSEGAEVTITLEPGRYNNERTAQVLASFDDCQEAVAGAYRITEHTHLAREQDGTWAIRSTMTHEDLRACQNVPFHDGISRTVCDTLSGRQGVYSGQHEAILWDQTSEMNEGLSTPVRQTLVYGFMGASCEANFSLDYDVKLTAADVDGDGFIDLTMAVTSTEGPFTAPLTECVEGDFEGPLEPRREPKKSNFTLTYKATPESYTEAEDRPAEVPISGELLNYF